MIKSEIRTWILLLVLAIIVVICIHIVKPKHSCEKYYTIAVTKLDASTVTPSDAATAQAYIEIYRECVKREN